MPLHSVDPGAEVELLREELMKDPLFNLLLIADVNEGLDPDVEAWWGGEGSGPFVVRYHLNWLIAPATEAGSGWSEVANLVDNQPPSMVRNLLGRSEAVAGTYAEMQLLRGRTFEQTFAALEGPPKPIATLGTARPAHEGDLDALVAMYADAAEMTSSREALVSRLPRLWVLEHEGAVCSAAVISAQTDYAAMIGGVLTPPINRRKGYASSLLHGMCSHINTLGKSACLFYHDAGARRVYLRLGFQELGPWSMIRFD